MTIAEFINGQFTEKSKIDLRTAKSWVKQKDFPFFKIKIGTRMFVDPDKSPDSIKQNTADVAEKTHIKDPKVISLIEKVRKIRRK